MGIQAKQRQWVEVDQAGPGRKSVKVKFEAVDLGDGGPVVPAVRLGETKWPSHGFSMQGQIQQGPTSFVFSVEDLRELVRLADERPEALGGS